MSIISTGGVHEIQIFELSKYPDIQIRIRRTIQIIRIYEFDFLTRLINIFNLL